MVAEVFGNPNQSLINKFTKLSKTSKGGISLSLAEFLRYFVDFIIIIVTARLLTPNDFGLVALCISCISIIDALTDIGIKTAVIQNKEKSLDFLSCGWFLIIFRNFCLFIILIIFL